MSESKQQYPEPTAGALIFNHEAEEYVWVSVEEALTLSVEYYTRVAIDKYVKNRTHG